MGGGDRLPCHDNVTSPQEKPTSRIKSDDSSFEDGMLRELDLPLGLLGSMLIGSRGHFTYKWGMLG